MNLIINSINVQNLSEVKKVSNNSKLKRGEVVKDCFAGN